MKPLLDYFPARRLASFLGIFLVVGIQSAFLLAPQLGPDPYRRQERRALYQAWRSNPTTTTKAAFADEIGLEDHHHVVIAYLVISSFVAIDVTLLYVYWRVWVRGTVA